MIKNLANKGKKIKGESKMIKDFQEIISKDLEKILSYNKNYDEYDEFIKVGQCLKANQYLSDEENKALWINWAKQSSKFKESDASRWESFSGDCAGTGYLYQVFKSSGGYFSNLSCCTNISSKPVNEENFNKTISALDYIQSATREELLELSHKDKAAYLEEYSDEDCFRVNYCIGDDFNPRIQCLTKAQILADDKLNINYIKINCFKDLDKTHSSDKDLKSFDNLLIEFDDLPDLDDQIDLLWKIPNLPIRKIVYSGGKSIHAICSTGAQNLESYRKISKEFYEVLESLGLPIDKSCKNASRSSRLPGNFRGQNYQGLLYKGNAGAKDLISWLKSFAKKDVKESFRIQEILKICSTDKGYRCREREIRLLIEHFFGDKIINVQSLGVEDTKYIYNGKFYEVLTKERIFKDFINNIAIPLEKHSSEFNFGEKTITYAINKTFVTEFNNIPGEEFNPKNLIAFKNGVYDGESLKDFDPGYYVSRHLDFNFVEDKTFEELETIIKEQVYACWSKQISWENFQVFLAMHFSNERFYQHKFLFYITGASGSGKSNFNDFFNAFVPREELISAELTRDNRFIFSSITPNTKIFQIEDSKLDNEEFLAKIKQLVGNPILVVERKGKNAINVKNNLFLKIICNVDNESRAKIIDNNPQYFNDKLIRINFATPITKDQTLFAEQGGIYGLLESYGDIVATYGVLMQSRMGNIKEYLKSNNYLNKDFNKIYSELLKVFIRDQHIFEKGEPANTARAKRKSITIGKLHKLFCAYLKAFKVTFRELNLDFFKALLTGSEKFSIYYQNQKRKIPSWTFVTLIEGGQDYRIEEKIHYDLEEFILHHYKPEECPIDLATGEIIELDFNHNDEEIKKLYLKYFEENNSSISLSKAYISDLKILSNRDFETTTIAHYKSFAVKYELLTEVEDIEEYLNQ